MRNFYERIIFVYFILLNTTWIMSPEFPWKIAMLINMVVGILWSALAFIPDKKANHDSH